MSQIDEPRFGVMSPGIDYIDRPGVYALVIRDMRLLVVDTASGFFLPGGGTDAEESSEDTLRRELLEETGFSADGLVEIGTARQYVLDAMTGIGYTKIETYFRVATVQQRAQPVELDHTVRWVLIPEALAGLREPAQVWAVQHVAPSSRFP